MNEKMISQFERELDVEYKGEHYLVRDNGAICRLQRANKRRRSLDGQWTFGNPCKRDGYMKICSLGVHRIIATAFNGEQPSPKHVVDHIDTNRRNNRLDNLRWVTRLQNILDNPKTLRRIEKKWGSVDGLLNDPNPAAIADPLSNRPWMRDADETLNEVPTIESLTPFALQRNWKIPSEFPNCPKGQTVAISGKPDKLEYSYEQLRYYSVNLVYGSVFSRNIYRESRTTNVELAQDRASLSIIAHFTNRVIKEWAVAKITFEEGKFVHESISTFFTLQGALKKHCQIIGIPSDESIDDYA